MRQTTMTLTLKGIRDQYKEVVTLRQTIMTLTVLIAAAALIAAFSSPASAAVTGVCSGCHTMHNSQGGAGMEISGTGPFSTLLRGSCAGCHAQKTANHVEGSIPQVYHTSGTNLAGGNFGYIDATVGGGASDTKGHNVICIDAAITGDANLSAPPGDEFTTGIASGATTPDFTCAGEKGCHGNRATLDEAASISGAHHGDDTTIDGTTVTKSYRFLLGVKGVENKDATNPWQNISAGVHNEYQGTNAPDTQDTGLSGTNPGTAGTISGLCGECHGNFHGTGAAGHGTSSAWIRHPTDILLPNTAPYSGYDPTTIAANYDATVPVAYTVPGTPARAQAVVMCLSCHGVHGTDYTDILRWNYADMNAGNGGAASDTGCFRCHMDKD